MKDKLEEIKESFYQAFRMQLGIGERKAKTLSEVAMKVLLNESNKLKSKHKNKMIDKIKLLKEELRQKENMCKAIIFENGYNERNVTLQETYTSIISRLDAIIEAEDNPDEAGKTAEEILTDFGCPELPFDENVTMYYPAILSAMEEYLNQSKQIKALHQIENLMERWHHARDNDSETLQKINDELVEIGLLQWFNKETPPNTEKRDQFGVIAESDKEIVCELCVYFKRDNHNTKVCDHCVDHNKPNEYYISK